ncbi:hypothetical protein KUTeg_014189, partial [Tegillarca granosa]
MLTKQTSHVKTKNFTNYNELLADYSIVLLTIISADFKLKYFMGFFFVVLFFPPTINKQSNSVMKTKYSIKITVFMFITDLRCQNFMEILFVEIVYDFYMINRTSSQN